jgi:hypothetical protein
MNDKMAVELIIVKYSEKSGNWKCVPLGTYIIGVHKKSPNPLTS